MILFVRNILVGLWVSKFWEEFGTQKRCIVRDCSRKFGKWGRELVLVQWFRLRVANFSQERISKVTMKEGKWSIYVCLFQSISDSLFCILYALRFGIFQHLCSSVHKKISTAILLLLASLIKTHFLITKCHSLVYAIMNDLVLVLRRD